MQALANVYRQFTSVVFKRNDARDRENPFSHIPIDLIILIFSHLNSYDLVQIGRTCRTFHQLSQDKTLDLAKLDLFKKMRTERLGLAPYCLSYFLDGSRMICSDKKNNTVTFEIRDLKQKKTEVVVDEGGLYKGELKDYFFFIFFKNSLKITFVSKENYKEKTSLVLSKHNISIKDFRAFENTLVLQIGNLLMCIKKAHRFFAIEPLEFDTFDTVNYFEINHEHLVISRTISTQNGSYNLHQLYHLDSEQQVAKAIFPQKHDGHAVSYCGVTDKYFIAIHGLDWNRAYAYVKVYDMKLRPLSEFLIDEWPKFHFGHEEHYGSEYFHCYENRLVAFLNESTLLFYDLSNGRLIKRYALGEGQATPIPPEEIVRISIFEDKVVATKKKSIELFDIHTGNLLHRFQTSSHPVWINLSRGYNLRYSIYDKKKRSFHLAHLAIPQNKKAKRESR